MPTRSSLSNDLFLSNWGVRSNPAAGANSSAAIGQPAQSEILLVTFTLVTDAGVADRVAEINLKSGATNIPLGTSGIAHTASSTFNYIASQNATTNAAGNIDTYTIPLPNLRFFDPDDLLEINIKNIEAGDQLSLIRIYRRMWRGAT